MSAVIFVGFRSKESYDSVVRIFGKPDIISITYDARTFTDVDDGDTVVFARVRLNILRNMLLTTQWTTNT